MAPPWSSQPRKDVSNTGKQQQRLGMLSKVARLQSGHWQWQAEAAKQSGEEDNSVVVGMDQIPTA